MIKHSVDGRKGTISTVCMSDISLVERILEGQTELFEILMIRNNELLYRTIRSYIDVEADVEDIMQDAYIKAKGH